jgi:hypothetical protein
MFHIQYHWTDFAKIWFLGISVPPLRFIKSLILVHYYNALYIFTNFVKSDTNNWYTKNIALQHIKIYKINMQLYLFHYLMKYKDNCYLI